MAQNGHEEVAISMSPATSRERFLEAHELIVRAWTEEGPFPFEGKHSRLRYVNVCPCRCSGRTRPSGSLPGGARRRWGSASGRPTPGWASAS